MTYLLTTKSLDVALANARGAELVGDLVLRDLFLARARELVFSR